ncbi:TPA: hypothetical protein L4G15_005826 [Pseudomonas aeruginosa]|nr:hypothetical protein [Pseudomonas aeruginosa]
MQEVNREELQDLRYELNDLAERYIRTFGNSKDGMEGLAEDLVRIVVSSTLKMTHWQQLGIDPPG